MKRKPLLLLLPFLLSILACRKEPEPDIPCDDFIGFTCLINGEPFKTQGNLTCAGFTKWYDPDEGNLLVSGRNCNASLNEIRLINFYIHSFCGAREYEVSSFRANITSVLESNFYDYDSILSGQVNVTGFTEDNYSADFTNGYVEGRFAFTVTDTAFSDTMRVTDGRFCMRF